MMRINEYNKLAIILGFKDVKINEIDDFLGKIRRKMSPTIVQFFDADYIAGKPHLYFAVLNALKAFEQGRNISEKLEVEILLYASGKRQIDRAIEMIGIKPKTSKIALLILASNVKAAREAEKKAEKNIPGIRDNSVLEIKGEEKVRDLMKTFGVTNLELETVIEHDEDRRIILMWLIMEQNALLTIKF